MGWIFQCLSPSFIPLGSLPFTSLRSVTVGSGRFGVGLLEKLELLELLVDIASVMAVDLAHHDVVMEEGQTVRV